MNITKKSSNYFKAGCHNTTDDKLGCLGPPRQNAPANGRVSSYFNSPAGKDDFKVSSLTRPEV